MTLNEYLAMESALNADQKEEYKKLAESDGVGPDDPTDLTFNNWHNDAMLALAMGLLGK